MVFRNVTEEGDVHCVEVSVRLTNGHFESWLSAPMGDKDAARAAIEAWMEAMDSVLSKESLRRREARNFGEAKTSALPETLMPEPRKGYGKKLGRPPKATPAVSGSATDAKEES